MAQILAEYAEKPPLDLGECCGCGCGCGNRLEWNDPLGPRPMRIDGKKVWVNEDCYFDRFSEFIDEHPIGGIGITGPGCKCPLD